MTEEETIKRLPPGKQRRMAMLSLAGVQFKIVGVTRWKEWKATWWDGRIWVYRTSRDLNDLLGYTYNVKQRAEEDV